MKPIYLDYSADTPADEHVLEVYLQTARDCFANPNAVHSMGNRAKQIMNQALSQTADLLSVRPDEIIFQSSATEANNSAIKGIAFANRRKGKHIISTFLEHSSVSGALTFLQEQGWEIDLVNLLPDGTIDLQHFQQLLRKDTVLCAVCAVDSELGTIQPTAEISEILKAYPNCRLHIDATQAVGKTEFSFHHADTISFAPHKFYGLKGNGVLYKRSGVILEPLLHGGASTTLYRSGTPDPASALACAEALRIALEFLPERYQAVTALQQYLKKELLSCPEIRINSPEKAIPHILNLSVTGIRGEEMRKRMDEKGICISVKSACSVPNTPSRAVYAVTHDRKNALNSWRVSLSHLTTMQEAEQFLHTLREIIKEK